VYNKIGAFLVACWLYLAFLLVVGFGYSLFWTQASIIYLLMRRKVDDTELDEVYLEDEEQDEMFKPPLPSSPPPPPPPGGGGLTMVEAPTLRPPAAPPAPPAPAESMKSSPVVPPQAGETPKADVEGNKPPAAEE